MNHPEILTALADPTRRAIFERLRSGEQPVGVLARDLPVSRPAVSQHLKVLVEAGLVAVRHAGTRRIYRLDPEGLAPLRSYLDSFWGDVLSAFAEAASASPAVEKPSPDLSSPGPSSSEPASHKPNNPGDPP